MPRWILPAVVIVTVAGLTINPVSFALSPRPLEATAAAERAGDWQTAAALAHRAGDRDRVRANLRRLAQARRTADPAFRQHVASFKAAEALNLYAETLDTLGGLYADRAAAAPAKLFAHGVEELSEALADPTFCAAHLDHPPAGAVEKFRAVLAADWAGRRPGSVPDARHTARDLVRDAQAHLGVTHPAAIVFELLCGAAHGLDEYTVYAPPAADGPNLAEYGLSARPTPGGVVIDDIAPDSWAAAHLGLHKGDMVTRVNGHRLTASYPAALTAALRTPGPDGHVIALAHDGPDDEAPAFRLPLPVPTVYAVDGPFTRPGVAHLRIGAFRPSTPTELDDALGQLKQQGVRAVVLDLRGNAGGSFAAALAVAGRFVGTGLIASARGQSAEFAGRDFLAAVGTPTWDWPLVLVTDGRTASAAELLAAACKDRGRATLVGGPTFGKGVVQSAPLPLRSADGRAGTLTVTVAEFLPPSGRPIHRQGITPHVIEPDPARQLDRAFSAAAELAGGVAGR